MAPACHLGFRLSTEAFFFVNWASVLSDHGCIRTSLDIQHPSLLFCFGLCYDSVPCSSSLSHAVEACSFDDSDYLFELKYDGFRALAYLENGHCRLVTLHGHFGQATVAHIH